MTKKELLRRIEELERRIILLESRPIPVMPMPQYPNPMLPWRTVPAPYPWDRPSEVTCMGATQ